MLAFCKQSLQPNLCLLMNLKRPWSSPLLLLTNNLLENSSDTHNTKGAVWNIFLSNTSKAQVTPQVSTCGSTWLVTVCNSLYLQGSKSYYRMMKYPKQGSTPLPRCWVFVKLTFHDTVVLWELIQSCITALLELMWLCLFTYFKGYSFIVVDPCWFGFKNVKL